ncbi:hypothetical protein L0F63_000390, partial [Massospora cicadina]
VKLTSEVRARVLVSDDFTLLQLHLLLLDILGFRGTAYQTHAFHQPHRTQPEYLMETELVWQSPYITYQTIAQEECEGCITELGPGAFMEHFIPNEATFGGKFEPNLLVMRQLRDERVYSLDAAFQVAPTLNYELDSGTRLDKCTITLLARLPLTSLNPHRPIILAYSCGQSISVPSHNPIQPPSSSQTIMGQLKSIQRRIDVTHQKLGDRCYICRHPTSECWLSSRWGACSHYCSQFGPCCDLCLGANVTTSSPRIRGCSILG